MHTLTWIFSLIVFSLFLPVWIPWDSCFRPMTHNNQYQLLTQSCSNNDSVGWLPVDHHLLVLLQRRKDNARVQAVIIWRRLTHASAAAVLIHPRFDIDTHGGERRCNFLLSGLTSRSCAPAVPSTGRTRPERHAACVAETARSFVCTLTTVPRL